MRASLILQLILIIPIIGGIDIRKCPPMRLPTNGYVVCDHLIGAFCAPVCNPGFVHETQPAQAYVCNPLRKAWATYPGGYPLPWPNCVSSTTRTTILKSAPAIKKSIVDQQIKTSEPEAGTGKESLWQRMLTLTSQLTQSKLKEVTSGAARSMQSGSSSSSGFINGNSKNANTNTYHYTTNIANANAYSSVPTASYQSNVAGEDENMKQLQFRRLQQYWDTYYKRYYESLGPGKLPDWMTRSPWSNDPERVEGALDTDETGKGDVPGNNTGFQNWNSYLQNVYQYPRPPTTNDTLATEMDNSTFVPPNSSSDAFIENVIENDLYSKSMMDKALNRDLYFEDQLIHSEEKKRPRLNATLLVPTTRMKTTVPTTLVATTTVATTATPFQTQTTASSYYQTTPYPYATQNSSRLGYNSSAYEQAARGTTATNVSSTQNNDTSVQKNSATNIYSSSEDSRNTASSAQTNATTDPYSSYLYSYNQDPYKSQSQTASSYTAPNSESGKYPAVYSAAAQTGSNYSSGRDNASMKASGSAKNSSRKPAKVSNLAALQKLTKSASSDDSQDQPLQAYVADDDGDDNTDYLEQLDISALVRELIKLETIRKQKQLLRRKKIQRENSKAVANLLVGDLFHGFFKNKKPLSQKGLKKHFLHKGRRLLKAKGNQSPLPKFNR